MEVLVYPECYIYISLILNYKMEIDGLTLA